MFIENSHSIEAGPERNGVATVKVIGCGGGGCNAVARMYHERLVGVEFVAVNTDAQHLVQSEIPVKIRIGDKLTRGLGVGGNPDLGREAAEENREELYEALRGSDMVFIAAGMGGGTGTGACSVVAEIAKETGALTIGVVTKPFEFEGAKRRKQAEDGIQQLRNNVDSLIVIPNDRLLMLCEADVTTEAAFKLADDVLRQGVQSIAELVTISGEINLDFADIKAIMSGAGQAWMAIGSAQGENRAVEAAKAAIASPILDVSIDGATGVLFNVTGGEDLTLHEVHEAAAMIAQVVDPNANTIFGVVKDPRLEDEVKITIIATGFPTTEHLISEGDVAYSQLGLADLGEDELDIPPFLRRHPSLRRRFAANGIS
ncbi:MAG: cell division protein FtsZ [SAR202 cluster bacterium Io17-Chloro-G3]|nr:MAG: cell division protein FtsZ [SAR202 cluster bacterium Io17-Chloro-G3]